MHINAHLDVEVVALENEDTVTVMLDLAAPMAVGDAERPAHAVVFVLDRSGSMAGEPLDAAKRALLHVVERLDGRDTFGLVTFDDRAAVVVPAVTVDGLGREQIRARIESVHTGGMTDMSSGYLRGLQEARRVVGPGGATIIMLSDGCANSGITDPATFRDMGATAAAQAITTSTIGVGAGYDDLILSELAIGGTGNHSFAEEGDAAAAAIAGELDGLLSKTIQAASLLIRPTTDAVAEITVLNDLPANGTFEGVMVELGDFYSGEERRLLFSVGVPAMAALGLATVAEFVLEFVSVPELESHTVTLPVSVNVVPFDVAQGRVPDPEVHHQKLILDVQAAKRDSERAMRTGDVGSALGSLSEARSMLASLGQDAGPDVAEELEALDDSIHLIDTDVETSLRTVSSSRAKRSRGYTGRDQGGKVGRRDGHRAGDEAGDATGDAADDGTGDEAGDVG